jgi:hypothetical protein
MSVEPEDIRLAQIEAGFARHGLTLEVLPTEDGDWQARWFPLGEPYSKPHSLVAGTRLDAAEDALAVIEGAEPPLGEEPEPLPE